MSKYPAPRSLAQHEQYEEEMARLVKGVMDRTASVSDELYMAQLMRNPPPPQFVDCDRCRTKDIRYEDAYPIEHIGLVCRGCNAYFCEAEREADREAERKRKLRAGEKPEPTPLTRQLGAYVNTLLDDPKCQNHKVLREQVKEMRKERGWKACGWCSICTRPLVKDNSVGESKVCKLCSPDGEKGKKKEGKKKKPVHSDWYVFDLVARGLAPSKK